MKQNKMGTDFGPMKEDTMKVLDCLRRNKFSTTEVLSMDCQSVFRGLIQEDI